jgi:thiamine-phosphate pyrophosphorylase
VTGAPLVHVVTDRRRFGVGRPAAESMRLFEGWLHEVIDARPDVIQIRERDLDAGRLRDLVHRVVSQSRGTGVRVVVNDRADVACATGAHGVHLRSDGPAASRVRELGASGWLVGRSIHGDAEAVEHRGSDYLLFGTVFPTHSKPAGSPVAGLEALGRAARSVATPVLAIGGITVERAGAVRQAGAAGVAGIGLFLPVGTDPGGLGPARAVAALRAAMLE